MEWRISKLSLPTMEHLAESNTTIAQGRGDRGNILIENAIQHTHYTSEIATCSVTSGTEIDIVLKSSEVLNGIVSTAFAIGNLLPAINYLLSNIAPRVHNIYREGEYPTLYCPIKRHCVKVLRNI